MKIDSSALPDGTAILGGDSFPDFLGLMPTGLAYCKMLFKEETPHDFIFLYTNPAFHGQTGLGPVSGQLASVVMPGVLQSAANFLPICGRVSQGGGGESFELFLENSRKWFSVQVFCPKPMHFAAVFYDITEQKSAEQAIKIEAERNQILLRTACDGVHVLDEMGNVVAFSDSFARMLGYSHAETAQLNVADWDAKIPKEQLVGKILELIDKPMTFETRHLRKDGASFDVEINANSVELGGQRYLYASSRDISERKLLEEQLAASSKEIQDLYNLAPCGYHSIDANGVFLRINDTELEWLGCSREEVVGKKKITDFFTSEGQALFARMFPVFLGTGRIEGQEFDLAGKDGNVRRVSLAATAIKDRQGNFIMSRSVLHDITESWRIQEKLQQLAIEQRRHIEENLQQIQKENAILADLIRVSAQPIGVGGLDGRIEMANAAFEELTGYTLDELKRLDWGTDLTPPEWREIEFGQLARLQNEVQSVRYEKEYIKKNGMRAPVELLVHLRTGLEGMPDCYFAFVTDITERKRAERIIRESEERWRFAMQVTKMGAWEMDLSGFATWRSQRLDQIFGYQGPLPEWSYAIFLKHVLPEDRAEVDRTFPRVCAELGDWSVECRIRRADGQIRWILAQGTHLREIGRSDRMFGLVSDITDIKQNEQIIKDADRRKDEFLAMLAHELRNPLAPIRNAVELMKTVDMERQRIVWCANIIDRQLEQLTGLVNDLLDVSRISRGLIELRKETLQLQDVLKLAAESIQPMIDARRQEFVIVFPPQPVWVEADRIRLAQVVINLINNAAKYTRVGGRIELSVDPTETDVGIRVADNGCGIDPAELSNIFDLFYQTDRKLDRSQGGLGIGLSIVKNLMVMHGGDVSAYSAGLGTGCEFVARLPRLRHATPSAPPAGLAPEAAGQGKFRILVVDDIRDIAESLAMLLRMEGHEVLIASDGYAALAMALAEQPDIMLLDIGLPGMDGYSIARALRKNPELKPIFLIAITGYGQHEDRRKSVEAGFDKHLVKPIDIETLRGLFKEFRRNSPVFIS